MDLRQHINPSSPAVNHRELDQVVNTVNRQSSTGAPVPGCSDSPPGV
jgi:hypothetical protein